MKPVIEAAKAYAKERREWAIENNPIKGRTRSKSDVAYQAFLAGVAWRDANPSEAVKGLVEALKELCDILDDREARKECDSFTSQPAHKALAALEKAKKAGGK